MVAPRVPFLRRVGFRTRLSALTALAVGVAIALASIASYYVVSHELYKGVNNDLRSDIGSVLSRVAITPQGIDVTGAVIRARGDGDQLEVFSSSGQVAYPTSSPPVRPSRAQEDFIKASIDQPGGGGAYQIGTMSGGGTRYRVLASPVFTANGVVYGVLLARPLSSVTRPLQILRLVLIIVVLAGIALAIGLGLLIATTTIRPVVRLTRAAEHVASTQDLDATIEVDGSDELGRLARAFNDMLGALRSSRQQQAQLVSDAGHELRTPLTSLRTNVEVLMRVDDLPPRDREELLSDVRAQVEELTTLIGDVVELARQDERQPEPTEIRLDHVVRRAVERAERRAPGVAWSVHLTPGSVRAQPALLERAVLNVLDNATKWSPPGSTIAVDLVRGDRWSLDVRDQGPGIAEEDLPRVFDRFYRAQSARSMPGSGLGLAIVHQVVSDHGGTVAIASPPGAGTMVHIELPTVVESEPEEPA